MTSSTPLLDPITMGNITLKNRIVMAPMTRCRANSMGVPADFTAEYYSQRANAGLVITEGTAPSANGNGYARVPGIYNQDQMQVWKKITQAVHDADSHIFMQIMHVGRIAHSLNKPVNAETVAPSAIKAAGKMITDQSGFHDMDTPRALRTEEIPDVINEYKQATLNALESGFDGVEFHAANGYLPMQFLSSNSNVRTDQYGGSVQNRIRFVVEALQAMISVAGSNRVGLRISPASQFNDMHDENPLETYTELLKAINPLNLAYVHVIRSPDPNVDAFKLVKDNFDGLIIANGGFDYKTGNLAIEEGVADLISFGVLYIPNPDLVERFKKDMPLNKAHLGTFYTPGTKGYTDYPSL